MMSRLVAAACAVLSALFVTAVPAARSVALRPGGPEHFRYAAGFLLPERSATPGAVRTDDVTALCVRSWPNGSGPIPEALRRQVFRRYGLAFPQPAGLFEVDALIPLSLGGAPIISNLWPEPPTSGGWRLKDTIERRLHLLVCRGRLGLAAARAAIRSPEQAYLTYVAAPVRGCCTASLVGVGFTRLSDPVRAGTVAGAVGQGSVFPGDVCSLTIRLPDHTGLPPRRVTVTSAHVRIPPWRWTVPAGHGAGIGLATIDCASHGGALRLVARRSFTVAR